MKIDVHIYSFARILFHFIFFLFCVYMRRKSVCSYGNYILSFRGEHYCYQESSLLNAQVLLLNLCSGDNISCPELNLGSLHPRQVHYILFYQVSVIFVFEISRMPFFETTTVNEVLFGTIYQKS